MFRDQSIPNPWGSSSSQEFDPGFVLSPLQGVKKARNKTVKSRSLKIALSNIRGYHLKFLWAHLGVWRTHFALQEMPGWKMHLFELLILSSCCGPRSAKVTERTIYWTFDVCLTGPRRCGFVFAGSGVRQQWRHLW